MVDASLEDARRPRTAWRLQTTMGVLGHVPTRTTTLDWEAHVILTRHRRNSSITVDVATAIEYETLIIIIIIQYILRTWHFATRRGLVRTRIPTRVVDWPNTRCSSMWTLCRVVLLLPGGGHARRWPCQEVAMTIAYVCTMMSIHVVWMNALVFKCNIIQCSNIILSSAAIEQLFVPVSPHMDIHMSLHVNNNLF